ncbi:hypothetical protein BAMA_23995 [Bacillus manliponensis]|uniref:NERD domain-containing protein n=1 Tax=Bacillus manliponensis TaxID=574376 RepID=A0A073K9Y7_9BACI|nr:hypothetical protein [Bacillus manliponensis]KEK19078.1 hypothetical protein BAMA_23995 [Bacillus manliponensis]
MLQAEIKGKFYSNSEDVLTSSVIGSMRYLSSPLFFVGLLNSSVNVNGEFLRINEVVKKVTFLFWERLENSEPDVLAILENEDSTYHIVCIEAKFLSGKSSKEDETVDLVERQNYQRDQLARELEDLYKESFYKRISVHPSKIKATSLIYLTNDTSIPYKDLSESAKHALLPREKKQLFWLSWSMIYSEVCKWSKSGTVQDQCILFDLKLLLERKELNSFIGLSGIKQVPQNNWIYCSDSLKNMWDGLSTIIHSNWKYGGGRKE